MLWQGYGHGYGDGCGDSYGFGYGTGNGFGNGDGFGFGDGSGSGSGYGSGYGYQPWGRVLATVGGHEVRHLAPWPYIAVGCQAHSVAYWRKHWKEIAEAEDVDITTDAVQKIFARLNNNKEK